MNTSEKLIGRVLGYLDSAEAFASKEIPAFVQEYLEYEAWEAKTITLICAVVVVACVALIVCHHVRPSGVTSAGFLPDSEILAMFAIFPLVVSIVVGTANLFRLKRISSAPRVHIAKELAK